MKEEIEGKFKELLTNFKEEVKALSLEYADSLIKESKLSIGDIVTLSYGPKIKIEKFIRVFSVSDPTKSYVRIEGELLKKDGNPRKKKEVESVNLEYIIK